VLESGFEDILPLRQNVTLEPERESISSEWSGTEEQVGPESINVAAEFAALAASVCEHEKADQQVEEQEHDRRVEQAAHPSAELRVSKPSTGCEHTDWQEASGFWARKEPLLLRDQTARKNLPALSSNLPSVLFAQIGALLERVAVESGARSEETAEAADVTEQPVSVIASEEKAREGKFELEALTIEPLIVRKASFQNDEAEQMTDATAEQSDVQEETSAERAESPKELDTLSTAWMLEIAKPPAEALACRHARREDSEGASAPRSVGLGAPPRSATRCAEPDESSTDVIFEIEQELFAPGVGATDADRIAEAVCGALPPSGHVRQGNVASAKVPAGSDPNSPPIMPAAAVTPAQPGGAITAARGFGRTMSRAAASDPLAAIKAMTDEERIALFT
jgi:hypothetical protein